MSARGVGDESKRKFSAPVMAAVVAAVIVLVAASVVMASALGSSLGAMVGGPNGVGGVGAVHTTPTATSTPSPTPSPTPLPFRLTLSVSSVSLNCAKGKTRYVTLTNRGASKINWSAQINPSDSNADSAGITVSPTHGDLDPGSHETVAINNNTSIVNGYNGVSGTIDFTPSNSTNGTGQPVTVTYAAQGCVISGG